MGVGFSLLRMGGSTGRDGDEEGTVGVGFEAWLGLGADGEGAVGATGVGAGMETDSCCCRGTLLIAEEWLLLVTGVVVVVRGEESREGSEEEAAVIEDDNDTGLDSGLLASPATREERRFRLERSSEVGVAVADEVLGCSRTGVDKLLGGALLLVHEGPPFLFTRPRGSVVGLTRGIELESLLLADPDGVALLVLVVPEEDVLYELTRGFERGRFCAMVYRAVVSRLMVAPCNESDKLTRLARLAMELVGIFPMMLVGGRSKAA